MNENVFPRTWSALREGVRDGVSPGIVAGLWSVDSPGHFELASVGDRRLVPTPQPVAVDTVFDLASITKLFTATLAARLVERGWIRWDTPLRSLIPEHASHDITLRHLLSHTAGFSAWAPFWEQLRDHFGPRPLHEVPVRERMREARRRVIAVAPEAAPGERALYSDISFLLLGYALEAATQMPLSQAVRDLVWQPMGMKSCHYVEVDRDVVSGRREEVAATEYSEWRNGVIQGQVHDDNCWAMGGYAGHAGAFGTAADVLLFAARLMTGFLSDETLHTAWRRVERPVGCERTAGWDTPSGDSPGVGRYFSSRTVGHWGFTGTGLWIDPEAGLAVTLLTNRVHPTRDNIKIRAYRPRFHDALRLDWDQRPR